MKLDEKDKKIIEILKQNSKLSTQQISKKLRIPITTIHNRIKKLEKQEIIKNYTVNLNYKKLNLEILAYILITINYNIPGHKINQEEIAKEIKKIPRVEEVDIMTGVTDILAKVRVSDIDELNNFLIKKLRNIKGIDKTQTMIVLSEY